MWFYLARCCGALATLVFLPLLVSSVTQLLLTKSRNALSCAATNPASTSKQPTNTTHHMSIQTLPRDVINQTNKQRTVVGGFLNQLFVLTIDAQQNGNKCVWFGRRFVFLRLQCSTPNSSNMFLSNQRNTRVSLN